MGCRETSFLPDLTSLAEGLACVLGARGDRGSGLVVLDRAPVESASSFPSEIVTCRTADGRKLRLFCKYAAGHDHNSHGHRGGVAYEARVYRNVLEPLNLSKPLFYGSYEAPGGGSAWFVLENLEEAVWVDRAEDSNAMLRAARWIGAFHAVHEARRWDPKHAFLKRYDAAYYLGWAERTELHASDLHQSLPWLRAACERFRTFVPRLLASPTVIHGEYYPMNILFREGRVLPIDWESAAVGAGEIDLAALVEEWPEQIVDACSREYQHARWPEGTPATFDATFAAARLYLLFRWLGDRPAWTIDAAYGFEQLGRLAHEVGLIPPGSLGETRQTCRC